MTELHEAARCGDHAEIRRLVAGGAAIEQTAVLGEDPDTRYPYRVTPLMLAAGSGDGASLATVLLLVELGADPDRSVDGRAALRYAASGLAPWYEPGGDVARLAWFLERAGDEVIEEVETDLLAAAIDSGDVTRVDLVLARGAYPDAPSNRVMELVGRPGWRVVDDLRAVPLVRAAQHGGEAVVRRLIAAGADPRIVDGRGRHAMFHVTDGGAARALAAAGLPPDQPARGDDTALRDAIFDGDLVRAAALLAAGADANAHHDRGFTVLMDAAASMSRDVAMLRLLVEHGADPHAVTNLGWNALHAAIDVNGAEANARDSVEAILGYLHGLGVDVEQRDQRGWTPMIRAGALGTDVEVEVLRALGGTRRRRG